MLENAKKGFTLPEVLVVMSIIGIVAALTIPQVGYEMQKKRNAAVLSRSVEHVETGCKNVILRHNSQLTGANGGEYSGYSSIFFGTSSPTFITGTNLLSEHDGYRYADLFELGDVLNGSPASSRITGYVPKTYGKTEDMSTANGLYASGNSLYPDTKTGAFIGIGGTFTTNTSVSDDDPISDIIFIDVNAENKPNELGKDIFIFGLADSCKMHPAGSKKMQNAGYPTSTSDSCDDNSHGTGLSCADRVVKDGFKINY